MAPKPLSQVLAEQKAAAGFGILLTDDMIQNPERNLDQYAAAVGDFMKADNRWHTTVLIGGNNNVVVINNG